MQDLFSFSETYPHSIFSNGKCHTFVVEFNTFFNTDTALNITQGVLKLA